MMTKKELKIKALTFIWGWASYLHEGLAKGNLSEHFKGEIEGERMTEYEAIECQKVVKMEADIILRKLIRIRRK